MFHIWDQENDRPMFGGIIFDTRLEATSWLNELVLELDGSSKYYMVVKVGELCSIV